MKHAVAMGSGAMIYTYIPSFIKTGSGVQKFMEGDTQTHRQKGGLRLLLCFQNKESRLMKFVFIRCLKYSRPINNRRH
jgi:hypothetical protein